MARKSDPILTVTRYFATAPIELAEQALTLARDTVRQRKATVSAAPAGKSATRKRTRGPNKPKPQPPVGHLGTPAPGAPVTPAPPQPTRRRRGAQAVATPASLQGKEPADLALPGVGPVDTVG